MIQPKTAHVCIDFDFRGPKFEMTQECRDRLWQLYQSVADDKSIYEVAVTSGDFVIPKPAMKRFLSELRKILNDPMHLKPRSLTI